MSSGLGMYVPQILMCLFLSMFLEVMLLSNIIFTYLLMGLMFCLIFILKTSMMVSNMKKHSP
ncbi:putative membrane protein [Escherichia coli 3030-1]|nr:putative membrane protein [Escherichia coli 3030-1]